MKKLRPIMFVGTGSDVGKSIIGTAFCRIFRQDGYHPAPFKAQNMALNSSVTFDGLEIGRAQAVQAEASGLDCHTDMNPLLLKPTGNGILQVVLNGKVVGEQSAYEYLIKDGKAELRKEVNSAFDRLEQQYNPIVMEGAGSVSEINLRESDIVNMPMAMHANANVILVADIDRGGVFASVYGSIMLLTEEERKYVKGILINKFRGDIRLFESGVKILEDLCHIPVLGVVPYYTNIHIEEEDSADVSKINDGSHNGYYLSNKCFGVCPDGVLDNSVAIEHILAPYTKHTDNEPFDMRTFKEEQYNKLADHVRRHVDMDLVYKIMKNTSFVE